jgi:hypothetical protein
VFSREQILLLVPIHSQRPGTLAPAARGRTRVVAGDADKGEHPGRGLPDHRDHVGLEVDLELQIAAGIADDPAAIVPAVHDAFDDHGAALVA